MQHQKSIITMTPHIVSFVTVDDAKTLEETPEVNHNTTEAKETHCWEKRSKKDDDIVNFIVPKETSYAEKLTAAVAKGTLSLIFKS